MHELGIVFHVIRAVENIGREQGLTDVASVTLELGQVSGVVTVAPPVARASPMSAPVSSS